MELKTNKNLKDAKINGSSIKEAKFNNTVLWTKFKSIDISAYYSYKSKDNSHEWNFDVPIPIAIDNIAFNGSSTITAVNGFSLSSGCPTSAKAINNGTVTIYWMYKYYDENGDRDESEFSASVTFTNWKVTRIRCYGYSYISTSSNYDWNAETKQLIITL